MSERTGKGATSGQSVPKSPKTKFRQKSQQEQTAASKLRMEKRGEKLEKAREKLAKQKPPKKPGPVKRAGQAAGAEVHAFVHGKLYEVEHENVGTEGAHRTELMGEAVLHQGIRHTKKAIREHPQKAVRKAEAKHIKATADYCDLEAELKNYLDTYESTHDYDEYHFDLDDIEHDPYVLISMLSALHEGAWTLDEVRFTLQTLFDRQYILTEEVVVEER